MCIFLGWISAILGTWQPVLELAGGGILSLPNGTLVIEEVSLTDEGLYSCNVENGVGQPLSKTVWMSVNSWYYIIHTHGFFINFVLVLSVFHRQQHYFLSTYVRLTFLFSSYFTFLH